MDSSSILSAKNYDELLRLLKGPFFDIGYVGPALSSTVMEEACGALGVNDTLLTLLLEGCGIDKYNARILTDALSSNTTLTSLSLKGNVLQNAGAAAMAKLLENNRTLLEVDLSSNEIGSLGAVPLAEALETNGTLIKLSLASNALDDRAAAAFANTVANNSSLLWLDLSFNDIGYKGGTALLGGLEQNTTLTYLGLHNPGNKSNRKNRAGEVLERTRENGMLQMRALKDTLDNAESGKWGRTKVMLVGEGKSGKTSLQRALLRLEFDPVWDSTVGVVLTETVSTTAQGWSNSIVHHAVDYTTQVIANATAAKLRESEEGAGSHRNSTVSPTRKLLSGKNILGKVGIGHKKSKKPEEDDDITDDYEFKKIFEFSQKSMAMAKKDPSLLRITLWDFGGQQVFHALHHLFITEHGLYLVVFDVTKIGTSEFSKHLKFWLSSIKLHAPRAPVLIVGTHVDKLSNPFKVPSLSKIVVKTIGKTGLKLVRPLDTVFFPVSNCLKQGVDDLRTAIDTAARNQDHVNALVRIQWIFCLDEIVQAGENTGFIYRSSETFQSVTGLYGLSNADEASAMLAHFHELGVIFYFAHTEVLRDVITTDPRWLLFEISKVIRDVKLHSFSRETTEVKGLESDVNQLLKHGMLTVDLALHLWGDERGPFLLDLMRNLLLLSSWEFNPLDEVYLLPSIANSLEESGDIEVALGELNFTCTVTFDFSETALLDGLIERLICLLVEYLSLIGSSDEPILGKGRCLLKFKSGHTLVRTEDNAIAIDIENESGAEKVMNVTLAMMNKIKNDVTNNRLQWKLLLTTIEEQLDYHSARENGTKPWFGAPGGQLQEELPYNLDEFVEMLTQPNQT